MLFTLTKKCLFSELFTERFFCGITAFLTFNFKSSGCQRGIQRFSRNLTKLW